MLDTEYEMYGLMKRKELEKAQARKRRREVSEESDTVEELSDDADEDPSPPTAAEVMAMHQNVETESEECEGSADQVMPFERKE
jgi:hypothetical protein